jgi:hypothetical protein
MKTSSQATMELAPLGPKDDCKSRVTLGTGKNEKQPRGSCLRDTNQDVRSTPDASCSSSSEVILIKSPKANEAIPNQEVFMARAENLAGLGCMPCLRLHPLCEPDPGQEEA